jgi:acetyl/propionyl-CoA carboxylase alpha subunit
MLAKVVAWGPTRTEAAARLVAALRSARVHGVTTNRDLLVGVLEHPEFRAGRVDTHFLDRFPPADLVAAVADDDLQAAAVAAALAGVAQARAGSPVPAGIPAGWRSVGPAAQPATFRHGDRALTVDVLASGEGSVTVDGDPVAVAVRACSSTSVDLDWHGARAEYCVHRVDDVVYVDGPAGGVVLVEEPRFPLPVVEAVSGSLVAPMPGAVVSVTATAAARVSGGDVLVTLEAMKMEHAVRAPADGVVTEVRVAVGDQVETGDVLVVLTVDDGTTGADGPVDDG